MADDKIKITIAALDQTRQAFEGVRNNFKNLENESRRSLGGITAQFSQIKNSLVAAFSGYQIVAFGRALLEAKVEMEKIRTAMQSAIGAANESAAAFLYVKAESERLGLSLKDQAGAFTKLAASAKGTALEGQGVRNIFSAIAEASTALKMSNDDAAGSLLAISQMISKGKVSAEELRGQLGERLPGAFNIAAKAMNVTTAEFDIMLKKGEVVAEDFLPKFAGALRDQYSGAVEDASHTTQAEIARMQTAFFDLKLAIVDSVGDNTVGILQKFTENIKGMESAVYRVQGAFDRLKTKFSQLSSWQKNFAKMTARGFFGSPYKEPIYPSLAEESKALGVASGETQRQYLEGLNKIESARRTGISSGSRTGSSSGSKASGKSEADRARDAYARLVDQADKFIRKSGEDIELSGLIGLRQALRENEIEYENTLTTFAGLKGAKLEEATASALAVKNMKDEAAVLKETNDQRQKAVAAAKEQAQHERDMAELARLNAEKYGTFAEGWAVGLKEFQENAITTFKAGRDAVASLAGAMSTTMSTMFFDVITARFESLRDAFKSFGDSILRIFTDLLAQMAVRSAMSGLGGLFGAGGILGSLFSAGAAPAAGSTFGASSLGGVFSSGLLFHGGGTVGGEDRSYYRIVPSAAFAGAPRLHSGLAADEYAAILRRGESVFTAGQTSALGRSMSGRSEESNQTNVNVTIVAADSKSINDMLRRNPSAVIDPITEALRSNRINRNWKELLR